MKHAGSAPRLEPPGIVRSSVSRSRLVLAHYAHHAGMSRGLGDDLELARLALKHRANAVADDRVVVGDDHLDRPRSRG